MKCLKEKVYGMKRGTPPPHSPKKEDGKYERGRGWRVMRVTQSVWLLFYQSRWILLPLRWEFYVLFFSSFCANIQASYLRKKKKKKKKTKTKNTTTTTWKGVSTRGMNKKTITKTISGIAWEGKSCWRIVFLRHFPQAERRKKWATARGRGGWWLSFFHSSSIEI